MTTTAHANTTLPSQVNSKPADVILDMPVIADRFDKLVDFQNDVYNFVEENLAREKKHLPEDEVIDRSLELKELRAVPRQAGADALRVYPDGTVKIFMAHERGVVYPDADSKNITADYNGKLTSIRTDYAWQTNNAYGNDHGHHSSEQSYAYGKQGVAQQMPVNFDGFEYAIYDNGAIVFTAQLDFQDGNSGASPYFAGYDKTIDTIKVDADGDGLEDKITIYNPDHKITDETIGQIEYGTPRSFSFRKHEKVTETTSLDVNQDGIEDKIVTTYKQKKNGDRTQTERIAILKARSKE